MVSFSTFGVLLVLSLGVSFLTFKVFFLTFGSYSVLRLGVIFLTFGD